MKIALDPTDPLIARLRPGLSAEATIDVRDVAAAKPDEAKQVSAR